MQDENNTFVSDKIAVCVDRSKTIYLLLVWWFFMQTSMIHNLTSEISTSFCYSNITIFHSAACFLYKCFLKTTTSFLKYGSSNCRLSNRGSSILMHRVYYYINLYILTKDEFMGNCSFLSFISSTEDHTNQ